MTGRTRVLMLGLWLLLLGGSGVRADADIATEDNEIPLAGRPDDASYSEAQGVFTVSTRAAPTQLEAETPLTLTLRVQAVGKVFRPPQRIDLSKMEDITERFLVQPPAAGDVRHPDAKTWEFDYRLQPRDTSVTEIPGIPFGYYNAAIRLGPTGGYQTKITDPISIHVLPHAVLPVPLQAPESAFTLAAGPGLLARQRPATGPGLMLWIAVLLAPPLLGLTWYVCWRRLHPDAARQARQRRSRAARHALKRLQALRSLTLPARQAQAAAHAVAGYLQERLELRAVEPTPAEAEDHLRRCGCSAKLLDQAGDFFRTCDAARFLPAEGASTDGDLAAQASRLILAVEAETCSPS